MTSHFASPTRYEYEGREGSERAGKAARDGRTDGKGWTDGKGRTDGRTDGMKLRKETKEVNDGRKEGN